MPRPVVRSPWGCFWGIRGCHPSPRPGPSTVGVRDTNTEVHCWVCTTLLNTFTAGPHFPSHTGRRATRYFNSRAFRVLGKGDAASDRHVHGPHCPFCRVLGSPSPGIGHHPQALEGSARHRAPPTSVGTRAGAWGGGAGRDHRAAARHLAMAGHHAPGRVFRTPVGQWVRVGIGGSETCRGSGRGVR